MAGNQNFQTLSEISKERAKKQPHQIDEILEEAPILARLKFEESSHDMHNVAEQVTDVIGASYVAMNAALPKLDAATSLTKVDLAIMGGKMEVPEDTARMFGGKEAYFAKKLPKIHKKTGMDTERAIIYGNWKAFALQSGNAFNAGATAIDPVTKGTYSLFAVRLVPGEHGGLYSPKGFGQGTMLNVMALNGGNLYESQDANLKGVDVYGIRLKAYLGWQILNTRTCAGIFNITKDHVPTSMMIDDMLSEIRATASGNTFLVCHQNVLNMLGTHYKENALQMGISDKEYNTQINRWNGIPVYTTYNMDKGTEPLVTFAP